jgi:hypothetical protein
MLQVGLFHVDQYLSVSSADLPPGCSAVVYSNGSTLVYWNQQADSPTPCGGKQAVTVGTVANSPRNISANQSNYSASGIKKELPTHLFPRTSWSSQIGCPRREMA